MKRYTLSITLSGVGLVHFEKRGINTLKVLKCGAAEGCRRPVGLIVLKMKKCVQESKRIETFYMK
jgi:hypothetical protein